MKHFRTIFLIMMLFAVSQKAFSQTGPPIYGQVISATRGPVAGVTVSLLHPNFGRSTPVFSQQNGAYFFSNVPPGQYYIEAYWGNTLLYRGVVNYIGGSMPFNIPLP